jgi:hypothetical protein
MSGRNWDRPTFLTRGRTTEHVSGGDIPIEFRTLPRKAQQPKTSLREEGERALKEFKERRSAQNKISK